LPTGEELETRLEPGRKPLGDFDRLVKGVLCGQNSIHGAGRAPQGNIGVRFEQGLKGWDRLRAIDLDFKILGKDPRREGKAREKQKDADQ
jgi:hypothetical protein